VAADAKQGKVLKAIRIYSGMHQTIYVPKRSQRRQVINFKVIMCALVVDRQIRFHLLMELVLEELLLDEELYLTALCTLQVLERLHTRENVVSLRKARHLRRNARTFLAAVVFSCLRISRLSLGDGCSTVSDDDCDEDWDCST
jgi:hypothetical protein